MRRFFCAFVSLTTILGFAFHVNAQVISVDFAGASGGGGANFTEPGDVAGVIPVNNWNSDPSQLASGSLSSLIDDSGATTSAAVTWSGSNNVWAGSREFPGLPPATSG